MHLSGIDGCACESVAREGKTDVARILVSCRQREGWTEIDEKVVGSIVIGRKNNGILRIGAHGCIANRYCRD